MALYANANAGWYKRCPATQRLYGEQSGFLPRLAVPVQVSFRHYLVQFCYFQILKLGRTHWERGEFDRSRITYLFWFDQRRTTDADRSPQKPIEVDGQSPLLPEHQLGLLKGPFSLALRANFWTRNPGRDQVNVVAPHQPDQRVFYNRLLKAKESADLFNRTESRVNNL